MERPLKREKQNSKLNETLEEAINKYDCVEVDYILQHKIDPNAQNDRNENAIDVLFTRLKNERTDDIYGNFDAEETASVKRWTATRIFESLANAGVTFDKNIKAMNSEMFLISIMHTDDVKDIEEYIKNVFLPRFDDLATSLIIKLAYRKGIDLLKDMNIYAEGIDEDVDTEGIDGSLYYYMSGFKKSTNNYDDLLEIARKESMKQVLKGRLSEPLVEGANIRDSLPDDIIDKIVSFSKGGRKKRKSTKRKQIKRKKRKSIFKRKVTSKSKRHTRKH